MSVLLDLLYPEGAVCLVCGRVSHYGPLCLECGSELKQLELRGSLCQRCGGPMRPGRPCKCDLPERVTARAAWTYGGAAAQLVQTLKFRQVRAAHRVLGEGMARVLRRLPEAEGATVTWITMPASRWRERSYDHAQLLAEYVADDLGLPCRRLLERPEKHELAHQVGLNAEQRAANLAGTFRAAESVSGTVVLVDDVFTTGSTVRTASACLLEAGADRVLALTACRTAKE